MIDEAWVQYDIGRMPFHVVYDISVDLILKRPNDYAYGFVFLGTK